MKSSALARLVKEVECAVGKPVDVEWADDTQGLWLLQARPIPERDALPDSTATVWSRANFKETLPELPSPLGLSLLEGFMETHIVRCYRELGCRIPPGVSSVRVIRRSPVHQRDLISVGHGAARVAIPTLLAEQMGGETYPLVLRSRGSPGGGSPSSWSGQSGVQPDEHPSGSRRCDG